MKKIALMTESSQTNEPFVLKFNSEDSLNDDLSDEEFNLDQSTSEKTEVKKRQRLTHLSAEEKMMRRKLKNRMAAQSARDRKKLKMEELEQEIIQVKAQNEKLKNENALLKENARVLLEENRKLLKHKQDTLNQQQQISNEIIPIENQIIGSSLKRKINPMTLVGVADESAVFINLVSQPKKQQLQIMFQKFICVLILYTMNLINKETSYLNQRKMKYQTISSNDQEQKVQRSIMLKITKLKVTLVNLLKLLKYYRQKPSSNLIKTLQIKNNPVLQLCVNKRPQDWTSNMNQYKLLIYVSLMKKFMKNKF